VRFALMCEPQQGLSYLEILSLARAAEDAGFETFFRSDHYTSFPGEKGLPTTDCWATLAGLARETTRIGLGSLVSPVTFRVPGAFIKEVATVDEMSGGRVELGVGAGWNEDEHGQLGLHFPDIRERADRLEEELAIIRGLWDEPDGWTFGGTYWQVAGSQLRPRGRRPNLIIGGTDKPRSLRLAARYADEYNISSSDPASVTRIRERLAVECRAVGRDPDTLTVSVMAGVLIGRDEAEYQARVRAQIAMFGASAEGAKAWLAARSERWVMGTPDAAAVRLAEFVAAGAQRIMLQVFLPRDLDHVHLMGETLLR
jgi:F420-dependent oxidoreductase-like protein